jgi:hypothetical protein
MDDDKLENVDFGFVLLLFVLRDRRFLACTYFGYLTRGIYYGFSNPVYIVQTDKGYIYCIVADSCIYIEMKRHYSQSFSD